MSRSTWGTGFDWTSSKSDNEFVSLFVSMDSLSVSDELKSDVLCAAVREANMQSEHHMNWFDRIKSILVRFWKRIVAVFVSFSLVVGSFLFPATTVAFADDSSSYEMDVNCWGQVIGDRVDGKPFGAGPPPEIRGMYMDDAMEHVMERFDDCGIAPDMRFDSHMGPVGDGMGHRAKHMFDEHMPHPPSDRDFVR